MGIGFWLWLAAFVLGEFLFMLNSYLKGTWSQAIATIFMGGLLGMVGLAFWLWGWKVGLGALVGLFVIAAIVQPSAARLANLIVRKSEER